MGMFRCVQQSIFFLSVKIDSFDDTTYGHSILEPKW
jgi:hypothetical protein